LSIAHPAIPPRPSASHQIIPPTHFAVFFADDVTSSAVSVASLLTSFAVFDAASAAALVFLVAVDTASLALLARSAAHFVAVSATLPTESHITLPVPFTTFHTHHIPPATAHVTAPVLLIVHFSIFSSEKSPPHIKAAIIEPIRVIRSPTSDVRPIAFQLIIKIIAQTIPANLVLCPKSSPAPANIDPMVPIHPQTVFGKKSKNQRNAGAADHSCAMSLPNILSHDQSKSAPAITRIIHNIFPFIINNIIIKYSYLYTVGYQSYLQGLSREI